MTGKLLTRAEFSRAVGRSPMSLYRYEKQRISPVMPLRLKRTRQVRYPEDGVQKMLEWLNEVEGEQPDHRS